MNATLATARSLAAAHRHTPGGLLPALHAIQDALGHVPPAAVGAIADEFNLSRAEVHGVITYYPHFRSAPAGRRVLQVCRAEACQARSADALIEQLQRRLGCSLHETTADGALTLEPVYCLGLCACSPALLIDGEPHARLTPASLDALLDSLGACA